MNQLEQYLQNSAIRAIDDVLDATYGEHKILMIASRQGIGKTSVLTQIAIDKMLQEKEIIHLSLSDNFDKTLQWYDFYFDYLKKEIKLDDELYRDVFYKRRMLLSLALPHLSLSYIYDKIKVVQAEVMNNLQVVLIDGFNFLNYTATDLAALKQLDLEIWLTYNLDDNSDYTSLEPFKSVVDKTILLEQKDNITTVRLDGGDKALNIIIDDESILVNKSN